MVCTWCGYVCVNLRVEEEGGRWGLAKKIPRACGLASLAKGWLMGRGGSVTHAFVYPEDEKVHSRKQSWKCPFIVYFEFSYKHIDKVIKTSPHGLSVPFLKHSGLYWFGLV